MQSAHSKMKTRWEELAEHTKNLVLVGSSRVGSNQPVAKPNPLYEALVNSKKEQSVSLMLQGLEGVACEHASKSEYSACADQATALLLRAVKLQSMFTGDVAFSIFLCCPLNVFLSKQPDVPNEIVWDLLVTNGTLNLDMIKQLCKTVTGAAIEVTDAIEQLGNYDTVLVFVFGMLSETVQGFRLLTQCIQQNKQKLMRRSSTNRKLMPSIMQQADTLINLHFKNCMAWRPGKDIPKLSLQPIINDILRGSKFMDIYLEDDVRLFVTKKIQSQYFIDLDEYAPAQKKLKTVKTEEEGYTQHAKNTDMEEGVKIPKNKYYSVYGKRLDGIPSMGSVSLCANFHLKGDCRFGKRCERKATHKKLSGALKTEFIDWCTACQEEAKYKK